ncbi:hypothetical protein WBG78_19160 [Chryseolinea sp. T2]|uniref:hypothetical protein n=1 Tax=Chryseolinea sp. T2 TaxID=3129255 RepID=UPI00307780AB
MFEEPPDNYPSREQNVYYEKNVYKEFVPEDTAFINSRKYDYVTIRSLNTKNPFKSTRELTKTRQYYDSLSELCTRFVKKGEDSDSISDALFRQCMNSVDNLSRSKKTAGIFDAWILRYDSLGDRRILFYRSPELEELNTGYWIAMSEDDGQSWKHYYTGLAANNFFYVKPNGKIRLMKDASTVQLEIAVVRQSNNNLSPDYELIQDNLVMEINLDKVMSDNDGDGLTDILERKFFTNPHDKDTDGDGIDDLTDRNPRHKNVKDKYSILYKYLLEHTKRDSVFVGFDYQFTVPPGLKDFAPETTLIVSDDVSLRSLEGTRNQYVIMTTEEFAEYRKENYIPLKDVGVSPMFNVDNRSGWKKIHISYSFGRNDYLIFETPTGWIVKYIGGYII